jgi:ATP-dependent helicase/nuclease subunit A
MFRRLATTPDGDLHANRLFLVGDEKQAIYEFRGGEVEVCQLAHRDMGETLEFTANFRSAPNLILFTNRFFEPLLVGDQPYEARAQALRYRDSETPPADSLPAPSGGTVTRIVDAVAPETDEQTNVDEEPAAQTMYEREARVIASLLGGIVAGEREEDYPGLAARIAGGEPTVGVLFRRTTHQHVYEDALRAEGVPYIAARGRGFYRREETRDLRNLLRVLEDPSRDVPLVGVLRSPFIGCSDAGLLLLTGRRRYRFQALWGVLGELGSDVEMEDGGFPADDIAALRKAAELLARWRDQARRLPVATVLSRALQESGAYAPLSVGPDGPQRVLNVEKFLHVIAGFEAEGAFTLGDLIRATDAQDAEGDAEGDADMPDGGAIQLLTVHRAKGLEWPLVIVPDTSAPFRTAIQETDPGSRRVGSSRLAVGRLAGLGDASQVAMSYVTPHHDTVKTFAWTRLEDERNRRSRAEQQRLLYVAFTRAKEHLVIGACDDGEREHRSLDEGASWGHWIETILADGAAYRGTHQFYMEVAADLHAADETSPAVSPTGVSVDTSGIWPPPPDAPGVARITATPVPTVRHASLRDDLRGPVSPEDGAAFSAAANTLVAALDEGPQDAETLRDRARNVAIRVGAPADEAAATVESAVVAHSWLRTRFPAPWRLLFGRTFDMTVDGARVVGHLDVVAVAESGDMTGVTLDHERAASLGVTATRDGQASAISAALAGWSDGARVRVLICSVQDGRVREVASA